MRHAAAFAAGEIGEEEAIQPLQAAWPSKTPTARCSSPPIHALGEIGGATARVALKSVLYEGDDDLREADRGSADRDGLPRRPAAAAEPLAMASMQLKTERVTSAGGVVFREGERRPRSAALRPQRRRPLGPAEGHAGARRDAGADRPARGARRDRRRGRERRPGRRHQVLVLAAAGRRALLQDRAPLPVAARSAATPACTTTSSTTCAGFPCRKRLSC